MFINSQTVKFLDERDHYLRRNAKKADELTEFDFKKIAESIGVSLKIVKDDADAYRFDLKHHKVGQVSF